MKYIYVKTTAEKITAEEDQLDLLLETGLYMLTVEECDVQPVVAAPEEPKKPKKPSGPPKAPTAAQEGTPEPPADYASANGSPNPFLQD